MSLAFGLGQGGVFGAQVRDDGFEVGDAGDEFGPAPACWSASS